MSEPGAKASPTRRARAERARRAGGEAGRGGEPDSLRTDDFDYPLPEALVAARPPARRDASRLLVVRRDGGRLEDRIFSDFPALVPPGDALVLNDTRVFPARLLGRKPTGARAEVLLLRPLSEPSGRGGAERLVEEARDPRRWEALVRPGGKLKPGRRVVVSEELEVAIEDGLPGGARAVRLEGPGTAWELVERYGRVPLPPYVGREDDEQDRRRYQTVYAERRGSVAAPTAGLHFTREMLARLEEAGVRLARITLHVGPGTFRPVDAGRPEEHDMDAERFRVPAETVEVVEETRAAGGRVWAVGTTVCRALESAATIDGRFRAVEGWTELFIRPPYRFRCVDRLLTNFHLPRSTLLMLVSAFAGHELTMRAYAHAVAERYRFYSYGDAMLVL